MAVAVTVLAGGLGVTLVTWLRQRYRPGSGSRHVDHVWLQTAQAGEPLRDKPRLVVTQGVVLWLPYPGGARLVTVTAPGRTDDLVRQLQPLTPALQESMPLQVAAEAVQSSCLRAEDGGLLLDVGALRQVAFVAIRGGSAVLATGDRLDLLDDPGPHDGSGPPAVRRHRLPTDDRSWSWPELGPCHRRGRRRRPPSAVWPPPPPSGCGPSPRRYRRRTTPSSCSS